MGVRPTFLITAAFAAACRMLAAGEQSPPTVSITAPAASSILSGVFVVTADATDNYGVAGVQFQVDGIAVGFEDTDAPHARPEHVPESARAAPAAGHANSRRSEAGSSVPSDSPGTVIVSEPVSGAPQAPRHTHWSRGPNLSVQVNVDEDGSNIIGDYGLQPSLVVDPTAPHRMAIGWLRLEGSSSAGTSAWATSPRTSVSFWVLSRLIGHA